MAGQVPDMLMMCVRLEHPHSTKRLGNIRRSYKGKGVSTINRCTHLTVDGSSFTSLNKHIGLIGTTGALMSRQRKHVGVCTLHYLYDVCGSIGLTGTSNVGSSTYQRIYVMGSTNGRYTGVRIHR